jgi:integrase
MGQVKAPVAEKTATKLSRRVGLHAVGGTSGLYLAVKADGRASWILRYMRDGRRRDMGLGSHTDVKLAEAREAAREQRKLITQGIDPLDAKRELRDARRADRAKRTTFRQCVDGYLDAHGDGWRNPKHRAQWKSTLETYCGPVFGDLNVASVDTPLVLKVLEPIWKTKTETAARLRGRIENVLAWATVRKYRHGENPARWKGHLDQLLAKPSKIAKVEHHAALPYRDIGSFMQALRKQDGVGAKALEFTILTAARSGEVRGAVWDEIDLKARVWTVPAERMKAKRDHIVPLSDDAVAILRKMNAARLGAEPFVFPGTKEGRPLSDMSMTAVLRRMERLDLTVHGFRSTFRDWCAESTNYARDGCEMALAHTISDKTEAAYRRGNLFQKRVNLMRDWEKTCAMIRKIGAVIPIKKAQS